MRDDGGVIYCKVCGRDWDLCRHTEDEWYEARLAETQKHINSFFKSYSELNQWSMETRRERNGMKRQIKELIARNAKLQRRVFELTGGAEEMTG